MPSSQETSTLQSDLLGLFRRVEQVEVHERPDSGQDDVGYLVEEAADLIVGVEMLGQHPDISQRVHQVRQCHPHLLEVVGRHQHLGWFSERK